MGLRHLPRVARSLIAFQILFVGVFGRIVLEVAEVCIRGVPPGARQRL